MLPVTLTLSIFFLFALIAFKAHGQHIGTQCSFDGDVGVCTHLSDCPSIIQNLLTGIVPKHLCGFVGFLPVVCCPGHGQLFPISRPIGNSTKFGERATARAKCQEYSQYVYQTVEPPNVLCNLKPVKILSCGVKSKTKQTSGSNAAPKEFPHMAAIGFVAEDEISWKCGGTLISERYVMSGATCDFSYGNPTVWVRLGDLNLKRSDDDARPRDYKVIERIKHPDYKPSIYYHDIALLKLETKVDFNEYVRPACLPTVLPETPENRATATGWGAPMFGDRAEDNLMKVTLDFVSHESCNKDYTLAHGEKMPELAEGIVDEWQICAGGVTGDTCHGDGGGPLAVFNEKSCMYTVVGITSFGSICGGGKPGVYTRVYNYVPWIESVVWAEDN